MARGMSRSQIQSRLREIERKNRQAISKYNSNIRKYNRAVDNLNAEQRARRARLSTALARLRNQTSRGTRTVTVTYRSSVRIVSESMLRLNESSYEGDPALEYLVELSEREAESSIRTLQVLEGDSQNDLDEPLDDVTAQVIDVLNDISADFAIRWRGADFALNDQNPDAARHFCTSVREVIVGLVDIAAPSVDVFREMPNCDKTDKGEPTRRAKIHFALRRKGVDIEALEEFALANVDNVLNLFGLFNAGTHGLAGQYRIAELKALRHRSASAILYLSELLN